MPAPSDSTEIDVVDEEDRPVGVMKRGLVREAGANFRVAHIFVIDSAGRLLLQQLGEVRTLQPYRWGSSVAAHLYAGEDYESAAQRRLGEELEIDAPVRFVSKVRMKDGESLKFIGLFEAYADAAQVGEPDHTAAVKFCALDDVQKAIADRPEAFTETFRLLLTDFLHQRDS